MENKKPIVVLENVTKIFNGKNWAIKKVNLKISRGKTLAIIGPNSSGKSVLVRLIASLIKPTSGIIEYNFSKGDTYSSIGFQFFHTNWPDGFKVKEIVNLYKKIYNIKDETWFEKINKVFDINSRWNRRLNTCSSFWLKLFSLYLAIIHKPELVILDEVSNAIGLDMKQKIVKFLKEYKEEYKATFILISPDEMLFEICDKVVVLQKGLILSEDDIAILPNNLTYKEYVYQILDAIEDEEVSLKPDPIFKPILKRFEKEIIVFQESYKKLITKKDLISTIDLNSSLTTIKNCFFHLGNLHNILLKVASTALDKKNIDETRKEIVILLKTIKKSQRIAKKESNDFKYKKAIMKFLENIEGFVKYLKEELYPIFKTSKLIIDGNEITAELSTKEQTKLKALKKKYIQEEIKLMKYEQKISKQ